DVVPELRALASDVAHFHRQVLGQLPLHLQVPVLDVRRDAVVDADARRTIRQGHGKQRFEELRHGQLQRRKRRVIGQRVLGAAAAGTVEYARKTAGGRVHVDEVADRAQVGHAVAAANDGWSIQPGYA